MTATLDGDRVVSDTPFATGWIGTKEERAWGRPADLLELADGSLLVSDDRAHVLYRIYSLSRSDIDRALAELPAQPDAPMEVRR